MYDPFIQGARDCRAGRPDQSSRFPRSARRTYRAGYRAAMRRVFQRLDAAYLMPHHFTQER